MTSASDPVVRGKPNRLSVDTLQRVAPLLDCVSERAGWNHCVDIVSSLFDADVVVAGEVLPNDRAIIRSSRGGLGVKAGAITPVYPGSQAAYVRDVVPISVCPDLHEEDRFEPSGALLAAGLTSSMSMRVDIGPLPGQVALFGTHSLHRDYFDAQDAEAFLALAPIFSTALNRIRAWDAVELNARIDPLTGLMNRVSIMAHLHERCASGARPTLLFLDLDGFKSVNDDFGHRVGDAVLRTVAQRFERTLSPTQRLGRLGGDEFLLVADDVDGRLLAERMLGHVEEVISVNSQVAQLSASIGVARRRPEEDATAMLERADRLMFQAKSAGRGEVRCDVVFDDAAHPATPTVRKRTQVTPELVQTAIDRLRIVVHPIVDAQTHQIHGVEVLTRGPVGHELEHPDRLFNAAIAFGLLGELELASKRLAFDLELDDRVELFINLEPTLLSDEAWMVELTQAWEQCGHTPSVTVEVTERSVLQSPGSLLRSVEACRSLGWMIALDDVGSRSESLAALRWIDPDVVKLDMSLITNDNPAHSAHVVAAIAAYRDMDRHGDVLVIAEGVETPADAQHADVLGADLLQGYLFGHPAPLEDLKIAEVSAHRSPANGVHPIDGNRIATKRELLGLTRHVEASVVSSDCVLVAAVQHVDNVSTRTRRQYEGLARRCGFVGMVGTDLSSLPGPAFHGVRTTDLEDDDQMRMNWQVITMSPTASIGLLATQLSPLDDPGDTSDMDRLFSYRLITDPGDVEAAVRNLLRYF